MAFGPETAKSVIRSPRDPKQPEKTFALTEYFLCPNTYSVLQWIPGDPLNFGSSPL